MYRKILLPVISSEISTPHLQHAIRLAKNLNAEILLLQVITIAQSEEPFFQQVQVEIGSRAYNEKKKGQEFLNQLEKQLRNDGIPSHGHLIISDKTEAEAITEHALQEKCDLIVVPNENHTGIGRWLFSSLGEKVRRHASVPVLFV
jgi:nucleotide-binding universal stress UspA family protein